jgi:hypothetical protein
MASRMEHNRYIGPTIKFKESFGFLQQKRPASQGKLVPCPEYAGLSGLAGHNSLAAWAREGPSGKEKPLSLSLAAAKNRPHFAKMAKASIGSISRRISRGGELRRRFLAPPDSAAARLRLRDHHEPGPRDRQSGRY